MVMLMVMMVMMTVVMDGNDDGDAVDGDFDNGELD